jgi:hypothetical protein
MGHKADRGHAIHAAAHLHHLLLLLLLTDLPRMSNSRAKKVLDIKFAARIKMASERGAIDEATHRDLVTINAVRVVFAHAETPVGFASKPVRDKASKFRDWRERASALRLFDEAVARCETAILARIDDLIFKNAMRAEKPTGAPWRPKNRYHMGADSVS